MPYKMIGNCRVWSGRMSKADELRFYPSTVVGMATAPSRSAVPRQVAVETSAPQLGQEEPHPSQAHREDG